MMGNMTKIVFGEDSTSDSKKLKECPVRKRELLKFLFILIVEVPVV